MPKVQYTGFEINFLCLSGHSSAIGVRQSPFDMELVTVLHRQPIVIPLLGTGLFSDGLEKEEKEESHILPC